MTHFWVVTHRLRNADLDGIRYKEADLSGGNLASEKKQGFQNKPHLFQVGEGQRRAKRGRGRGIMGQEGKGGLTSTGTSLKFPK